MSRFTAACRMVVVGAGMTAVFFIHLGALRRNFARSIVVAKVSRLVCELVITVDSPVFEWYCTHDVILIKIGDHHGR